MSTVNWTEIIEKGTIQRDVSMAEYTSLQAGGRVELLVTPGDAEELEKAVRHLYETENPFFLMGRGTNLLVRDGGYPGVILRVDAGMDEISGDGPEFKAGAGAGLAALARHVQEKGYTGLEFASGIPGSVGGGIFMNAGAYGGELKDVVSQVEILKGDGSGIVICSAEEMKFGYRRSILQETKDIVLSATVALTPGDRDQIGETMRDLNRRRNEKQPMDLPSAGSFFKRPEGHYAGTLIQEAGLKGLTVGGAQVSELHAGFIVNRGGATATDIIQLMHLVQARVEEQSGVLLEPEVRIIGQDAL